MVMILTVFIFPFKGVYVVIRDVNAHLIFASPFLDPKLRVIRMISLWFFIVSNLFIFNKFYEFTFSVFVSALYLSKLILSNVKSLVVCIFSSCISSISRHLFQISYLIFFSTIFAIRFQRSKSSCLSVKKQQYF